MNKPKLDENLGYLFEVGFNIGMLAYIEQNQITHHFGDLYRQDLQELKFSNMMRRLAEQEQVISQNHRKIIEKWCTFFIQKSFLAGLNFFSEYIESTGWKKHKLKHLDILYYQCCFSDNNSLGTYPKAEKQAYKEVLTQLGDLAKNIELDKYSQKGEFLHADTLMLLRCGKDLRMVCIDYSIFSIKSIRDLLDVDSVEVLRNILLSELSYLKTKSVFSNLGLDTKDTPLHLSESLKVYYKAFKRQDKETNKTIQAGSYAYSFSEFLKDKGFLSDEHSIIYNIVGYSDRGISAMTLNRHNCDILETCSHIYKNETRDQAILEARQELFNLIKRKVIRSFQGGKEFIEKLLNISEDGITSIIHPEHIKGFINSIDIIPENIANQLQINPNLELRQAHAELIKKELASDANYIFLTGNPGIGKTTAISDFLKSEKCLDDGFLLFYISPRIQVNLDILEKFTDPITKSLSDDRIFTINTNSVLINNKGGNCAVHYISNRHHNDFTEQIVHFINQKNELETSGNFSKTFQRLTEEELQHISRRNRAVLDSICEAIYTVINKEISNNIVATVAVQSLKKLSNGQDTLEYFKNIFRGIYNDREGKPIEKEMKALSRRVKHLLIMIDEITGDNGGVEFLNGVSRILRNFGLFNPEYGFNVKIIVADASIVEPDVIKQHLSETSAEPNKIFFRKAKSEPSALSLEKFTFKTPQDAVVINANSYPAKSLQITYKLFIESIKFHEKIYNTKKSDLRERVQSQIIEDINTILSNPSSGQIIVYIQDKARLAELIEQMKEEQDEFKKYDDYLEIHASLSETEKKQIFEYKNRVKIIFMTASASRGLSFPKTKHILVDIPRFEIEKNLMEVIQVIYRGRGNYTENGEKKNLDNEEKDLIFYLSEQAVYYPDNPNSSLENSAEERKLSLRESVLSLLNILLILKASIMTRIFGYGKIGNDKFIIIPIGGKSVFTAGQTFSSKMSSLIKQLKKEHYKDRYNDRLKEVYSKLENLLSSAEIILRDTAYSEENKKRSYLDLQELLNHQFLKILNNNFADLLDFFPLQTGYISGSLLIVPLAGRVVEENYKMRLEQELLTGETQNLLDQLNEIYDNNNNPPNLRFAIYEAIDLVHKLQEQPVKTQRLEQNSQYDDQYYVLPLFTFLSSEFINEYFASDEEEPEDQRFRDILENYIRSIYPVGNVLPIGHKYKNFPFLVFRSYSLNEIRSKLFTDKYFLTSNDLNVLNLILYQDS